MPSRLPIKKSLLDWFISLPEPPKAVVLDVDGVLILQQQPLAGAKDLLSYFEKEMRPFAIMTNAADESVEERVAVLAKAGLTISPGQVTSSGHPIHKLVTRQGLEGERFFMMAKLGTPCYAEAAGLSITRDLDELDGCGGVLIGEGPSDWRSEITAIVNFFRSNPDAFLICPNPDPFFPIRGGTINIGAGGIAEFIVEILGRAGVPKEPIYLGKPFAPIFEHCHLRLEQAIGAKINPSEVLMVGDMLEGDILGGNNFGYQTALLLTGGTKAEMLQKSTTQPNYIFEGI